MTEDRIAKIITRAIDTYGYEAQLKVAIEKMSELTKAICKLWRADAKEKLKRLLEDVAEEATDVQIMIYQLDAMLGADKVDAKIEKKLERLEARLDEKEREERDNERE